MLLFALSIAPGIAICLFIYWIDKFERERWLHLIIAFGLGMVSTIPALLIQLFAGIFRENNEHHSVISYLWFAFVVVALTEEGCKFLMLRIYAYPKKFFNEPFDGIVYAVVISMGFATVENFEYIQKFGVQTGISRFFLSVPAHASFAVLMGYYIGLAKFNPHRSTWLMIRGLLVAVIFHGAFDFFLFVQQNETLTKYVSTGLLSFCSFVIFYIAIRLALRTLRMHQSLYNKHEEETKL